MMWTYETSTDVQASRERLWALLANVDDWGRWNAGIERIELLGPFATGATFRMQPPGMDPFLTTLADVRAGESFTDVTEVGATTVRVFHGLRPLGSDRTRVTYRAEVSGPEAEEVGPMVTADFGEVLAALKATAERESAFGQ